MHRTITSLALLILFGLAGNALAQITFSSMDTPLFIPPDGPGGDTGGGASPATVSTIVVGQSGTITDLNVRLDITHTFDSDLDISLTHVDTGTTINLSSDNGGAGDDYTDTTFDDEAGTAITAGAAPFTGSFSPEQALSAFDGENIAGTWTLTIQDDAGGDEGTLNFWELIAQIAQDPTGSNIFPSLQAVGFQRTDYFLRTLSNRLGALDDFGSPFGGSTFASAQRPDSTQLASFAAPGQSDDYTVRGQSSSGQSDWNGWVQGYGMDGNIEGFLAAPEVNYDVYGGTAGVERWLSENLLVGAALGYARTNVSDSPVNATAQVDGYQLGLYGKYHGMNDNYLLGTLYYGHQEYDTTRNTIGGAALGNFDGDEFAGYLELGMVDTWRRLTVQPLLGLQYMYLNQTGFTETGAGNNNLTVAPSSVDSLRASAGVRIASIFDLPRGCTLVPEIQARYVHEFFQNNALINANFGGGGAFAIQGVTLGQEFAVFAAGVTTYMGERLRVYAGYDLDVSNRHAAHSAQAVATLIW